MSHRTASKPSRFSRAIPRPTSSEPALLADQSGAYRAVRDRRRNAFMAATGGLRGRRVPPEYAGRASRPHRARQRREIYSLVANQEYKRAFSNATSASSRAPARWLGGGGPEDKYGLTRELIHPLRPWLRAVNFHGPLQVTAVKRRGQWCVIEYNIRIGVTSGAMILRLLTNPLETLLATTRNESYSRSSAAIAGSARRSRSRVTATLHPDQRPTGALETIAPFNRANADVWWSEVTRTDAGKLMSAGHRLSTTSSAMARICRRR